MRRRKNQPQIDIKSRNGSKLKLLQNVKSTNLLERFT